MERSDRRQRSTGGDVPFRSYGQTLDFPLRERGEQNQVVEGPLGGHTGVLGKEQAAKQLIYQ